jgi:outer membrane lipoprotein-sorting protein
MKRLAVILGITLLAAAKSGAQTSAAPTKEQVLAKMDANAKAFKTLDATIERREWDFLTKKVITTDSGKLYVQMTKSSPRLKLDITEPKKNATAAMIDDGKYELYESATKSLTKGTVKDTNTLQLMVIGFGVTSDTIQKKYAVERVAQEALDNETATVIDFKSRDAEAQIPIIRLWLSPKDWLPLKMELTKKDKDTWTFTYKEKKLNSNLSSSTFKLNYPSDAKRR